MTHKKKRVLSFLLTFALILSLIPMQVFAVGNTKTEQAPNVTEFSTKTDSNAEYADEVDVVYEVGLLAEFDANGTIFHTVEELEAILENGNTLKRTLFYEGSNPFSVQTDVEIPSYINLEFQGLDVVVEKDTDMTVKGDFYCGNLQVLGTLTMEHRFNCRNLDVEGTMISEERFSVSESVDIAGELTAEWGFNIGTRDGSRLVVEGELNIPENGIQMQYPAALRRSDVDNINFEYDWQRVDIEMIFEDADELADSVKTLSNTSNYLEHNRVNYRLYTPWDEDNFGSTDIVIEKDLEILDHLEVQFNTVKSVKIAADATVTNYGEMNLLAPITVEGKLVNEGMLNVQNRRATENDDSEFNGKITLSESDKYSGDGELQIHVDQSVNGLEEVLVGFNLDEMKFRSNTTSDDNMTHYWLVRDDDGGNGPMNGYEFDTFDKLVELVDEHEGSFVMFDYTGDEPLVIEESFTLPSGMQLELRGEGLEIPSGVTFIANDWIYCGDLTVAGTMDAEKRVHANGDVLISGKMIARRALQAGDRLEITGTLEVPEDTVHMNYPGVIKGIENVSFNQEWQSITQEAPFVDMAELKDRMETLAQNYIEHERVRYTVWIPRDAYQGGTEFEITEDITIPAHVELQFNDDRINYAIKNGVTVTNKGKIWISTTLTIDGSLVNDKELSVSREGDNQGKVIVSNTGKMIGNGGFWVGGGQNTSDWTDIISVPTPADYDVRSHQDPDGNRNWTLTYAVNKKKLGTPINLEWGTEYREQWDWDEQNQMGVIVGWDKLTKPGFISWETVTPDQARAEIKIYRVGDSTPVHVGSWGFDPQHQPQYRSADDFLREDRENAHKFTDGTYYFTVQSIADSIEYRNSDVADSRDYGAVYTYVSASNKLSVPSGLTWDDRNDDFFRWADWNDQAKSQYLDGYWVLYYYSPTKDGVYEQFGGNSGRWDPVSESPFENYIIQEKGIGYYKFKVKALSSDIEKMGNSEWSAWSPILDVKDVSIRVNDDLKDLITDVQQGNATPDDIRTTVQQMDTQELQAALAADKDNVFATQNLAQLEQMAGGGATVEVTPDASAFNVQDVAIVGANLNNKAQGTSAPIKLVVDKPEKQHVIPERYNSSVAVRFSMNLENVEDPKELDVPVKITLPVPNSINPDFLVILHYNVDGTHELIRPHVYWMNGKCYADFVLTRFSDFVMVELENSGAGDADVDDNDHEERSTSKAPAVAENPLPSYVVSGQWTSVDGKWMFTDNNGVDYKSMWAAVENPYANVAAGQSAFDWFFFDATGYMMTGWVFDGGRWYYLNPVSDGTQGRMMIGWQFIDGKWYYLNPVSDGTKGAMITDSWIDTYYVDVNGVWDETKTQ